MRDETNLPTEPTIEELSENVEARLAEIHACSMMCCPLCGEDQSFADIKINKLGVPYGGNIRLTADEFGLVDSRLPALKQLENGVVSQQVKKDRLCTTTAPAALVISLFMVAGVIQISKGESSLGFGLMGCAGVVFALAALAYYQSFRIKLGFNSDFFKLYTGVAKDENARESESSAFNYLNV